MQLTHFLTIAVLFAGSALAAPSADAHREKPAKPNHSTTTTTTNQSNSCGNGAAPYCCNTDNGGSGTSCSVSGKNYPCSSQASYFKTLSILIFRPSPSFNCRLLTHFPNRQRIYLLWHHRLLQFQQRKSLNSLASHDFADCCRSLPKSVLATLEPDSFEWMPTKSFHPLGMNEKEEEFVHRGGWAESIGRGYDFYLCSRHSFWRISFSFSVTALVKDNRISA